MRAWPFRGRESELAVIRSAFAGSVRTAVLLAGPPGVGKTRLAGQVTAGLSGVRQEWVRATRAAAVVPFGAVVPLLPGPHPGGPVEVMKAAARTACGWGGRRGVVLIVDDVHLLDDASAALVAHLVTSGAAFVVMTARTDAPVADAVSRLCRDGLAEPVEVAPLPDAVMDTLIDEVAPADVGAAGRRRLHRLADGNPLALRELLDGAQPGGLVELVVARLRTLSPAARRVVELVVCGEPLPVLLVERIAGAAAVRAAEDGGLVVVERSGDRVQARLVHPLYGEALRARMRLSQTRQVYRQLAAALLRTPLRRRGDPLLAAIWQVEAGVVSRPAVVQAGAWQAIGHADLELAERLARAARAAEPGPEADRLLAEILSYRGRPAQAAALLSATPADGAAADPEWAVTRAEALYWATGDTAAAWAALDTASAHPTAEASRSWLSFFAGRCADAARLAGQVLDRGDAEPKALIWASAAGTAASGFLGDPGAVARIHRRGAAVAARHVDTVPWGTVEVDTGLCLAQLAGGQPAAARATAAAGYQAALDGGAAMMLSGWALYGGLAATACGQLREADRLLAEALAGFGINDSFRMTRCGLTARASVRALLGDATAGLLIARADRLTHPCNRVLEPWMHTWRAWTAYATGDLPAAISAACRAADLAHAAGMPGVEALARYDLCRLGAHPDLDRLHAIDHELARLTATAAEALRHRDGAHALETAAQDFETRGYRLHAAEAYTVAARRHHRHRRTTRAQLADARAARLRAAFPAARTLLLRDDRLIGCLTARERDVVFLAVRHSSAEIAAKLDLAVPTVNNNLARAYIKLGITGRPELRALLSDSGRI